jgi:hypothetical protein
LLSELASLTATIIGFIALIIVGSVAERHYTPRLAIFTNTAALDSLFIQCIANDALCAGIGIGLLLGSVGALVGAICMDGWQDQVRKYEISSSSYQDNCAAFAIVFIAILALVAVGWEKLYSLGSIAIALGSVLGIGTLVGIIGLITYINDEALPQFYYNFFGTLFGSLITGLFGIAVIISTVFGPIAVSVVGSVYVVFISLFFLLAFVNS